MQSCLADVGVSHNHLPMLAEDAMKQTRLLVNNPREMTYEAALAIYQQAL
jgi:alcohol dehydrogenase class IV